MVNKVADKSVGKPYSKPEFTFQVKCNLFFHDPKVAQALRNIITSFETSAMRRGNNGENTA